MIIFREEKNLFIILLLLFEFTIFFGESMSANEIQIPLFAVDINRMPVDNLDKKDLKLYLNDKQINFSLAKVKANHNETNQKNRKLNIIILDSTLTNYNEFVKGKRIAEKLVKEFTPGDTFAIIQVSPLEGLRLILPPETDKTLAFEQINKLVLFPALKTDFRSDLDRDRYRIRSMFHYLPLKKSHQRSFKKIKSMFQKEFYYETQILRFSYSLSKFKNALNMIDKLKVVYLVSGGLGKELSDASPVLNLSVEKYNYTIFFKNLLKTLIKEINNSGSLLIKINPGKPGNWCSLAKESSYYELLIPEGFKLKEKVSIRLSAKREDIRLLSPKYMALVKPYKLMSSFKKRLFLIDILLEEPWIQLAACVEKVPFKITANTNATKEEGNEQGEESSETVEIEIPEQMYRGEVDAYTLYINPKDLSAKIDFLRPLANDKVTVHIKKSGNNHCFFIIVEATEFYCIYNQVK